MKYTNELILRTSPILAVIATINQHHLLRELKHLSCLGEDDPVQYEDETGVVDYEVARNPLKTF